MVIILIYLPMINWPFKCILLSISHVHYEKIIKRVQNIKCAFISLKLKISSSNETNQIIASYWICNGHKSLLHVSKNGKYLK